MSFSVMPLPFKPGRLDGLSERLLASHYENNYGGAVRRLNALDSDLATLDWATTPGFAIAGRKREQLLAMGSVVLHEIYFDGLGGEGGDPGGDLATAIEGDFGSLAHWRAEFMAIAKSLAGGSGWALLSWSPRAGRLVNHWAADHAHGPAGTIPILALDMYEHAYALDFGAAAAAYVEAVMRNLHWPRIAARWRHAQAALATDLAGDGESDSIAAERLQSMLDHGAPVAVLDVRMPDDLASGSDRISGAQWCDPARIADWPAAAAADREIVAYCVYGFQVSRDAVATLRRRGLKARNLAGGLAAWHAIGGDTEPIVPSQMRAAP